MLAIGNKEAKIAVKNCIIGQSQVFCLMLLSNLAFKESISYIQTNKILAAIENKMEILAR